MESCRTAGVQSSMEEFSHTKRTSAMSMTSVTSADLQLRRSINEGDVSDLDADKSRDSKGRSASLFTRLFGCLCVKKHCASTLVSKDEICLKAVQLEPSSADVSTQTDERSGKIPVITTAAEQSAEPNFEPHVEETRAVGKAANTRCLHDNEGEAQPKVLAVKDAAAGDDNQARPPPFKPHEIKALPPITAIHSMHRDAAGDFPSHASQQEAETTLKTSYKLPNMLYKLTDSCTMLDSMDPPGNGALDMEEHRCTPRELRLLDLGDSESANNAASPGQLTSYSVSHRFLSPEETDAMVQMQSSIGKFSYYITTKRSAIIYLEDDNAIKNQKLLQSSFMKTTGNAFRVVLKETSFEGKFCTHRIGAKITVNGQQNTVGMYVTHNGILYFISSAHNFFQPNDTRYAGVSDIPVNVNASNSTTLDESRSQEANFVTAMDARNAVPPVNAARPIPPPAYGVLYDVKQTQFDVMGRQVPIGKLYYIFSNICPFPDANGRRIMHTADISICQAPIFTHLLEKGLQQFTSSLNEGQDACPECKKVLEDCATSEHTRYPCRYKVLGFHDFGIPMCGGVDSGDQALRSHDSKLLENGGALVRCRPAGQNVVAGRVISFDNMLIFNSSEHNSFNAFNVLLIKPESESDIPQNGDSGSVWVLDGTTDALAITIGMGKGENGRLLWAAAPLQPLLEQLSLAFADEFPHASEIKPVQHFNDTSATMAGGNATSASQQAVSNPTHAQGGNMSNNDSAYRSQISQETG